jgi:hypothetical protein
MKRRWNAAIQAFGEWLKEVAECSANKSSDQTQAREHSHIHSVRSSLRNSLQSSLRCWSSCRRYYNRYNRTIIVDGPVTLPIQEQDDATQQSIQSTMHTLRMSLKVHQHNQWGIVESVTIALAYFLRSLLRTKSTSSSLNTPLRARLTLAALLTCIEHEQQYMRFKANSSAS